MNKKKIYYCLAALLATFPVLNSCSFLEVDELGKSDTDTFFSEMEGLRTARMGLYRITFDFFDQYLCKYAEVAGESLQSVVVGSGGEMYYQYNFLSTPDLETTAVGYLWKRGYAVITNANTILNYSENLKAKFPDNADEIRHIEAEACFMRALVHFSLVCCYAQPYGFTSDASHLGIPVADHVVGANEQIARSSVRTVYDQIIRDLNTAYGILGDSAPAEADYVSGLACDALLARAYLYMGDYGQAESYSGKIISVLNLTSYEDYADMFTGEELGDEAVFRLSGYYAGSSLRKFYDYESASFIPANDFIGLFAADDIRRTLLEAPDGSAACMKYYDMATSVPDEQFYYLTVLRLSEMYLIRAEARCMQDDLEGAASDLKKLQARARNVSEDDIVLSYADAGGLMELIKTERRKELFAEGHRFFDLARWGDDIVRPEDTNSSMKILEYPDYRYALPIPQVEMDVNEAMVQNEGY